MDALPFLNAKNPKRYPVYALVGDENFLKRRARERIVSTALGDEDPEFAVTVFQGDKSDKLDFSTVRNELDTLSFLASCRVVVVENADAFVTDHRQALEAYAANPNPGAVLVLDVKTFPDTTRLAKALPDAAKVACKALPAYRAHELKPWCIDWAKTAHKKKLSPDAAELLLDLVGPSLGLLDQELEKLAVSVGPRAEIAAEDVDRLVGRSRAADVFRILDAIGEGRPGAALSILEELFAEGEHPLAVMGGLTKKLRELAAVGRLVFDEKMSLDAAMDAAGVPKWPKARESFQKQLRHLGGRRLMKLTDWLVEINFGLKGGNPLPERVQVERLIVLLARPREETVRK